MHRAAAVRPCSLSRRQDAGCRQAGGLGAARLPPACAWRLIGNRYRGLFTYPSLILPLSFLLTSSFYFFILSWLNLNKGILMKVYHKYAVGAYSGTIEDGVYWPAASKLRSYMRKYVVPRATQYTATLGSIAANLAVLWGSGSAEYKADLKTYTERAFGEYPSDDGFDGNRSPYANFIKLMYAWAVDNPSVDLTTITSEDFGLAGGDVSTVKNAVLNGYLPAITNIDDLTETF